MTLLHSTPCAWLRPRQVGWGFASSRPLLLALMLLLSLWLWTPIAAADAPITVVSNTYDYTFSQSLDFELQASADDVIEEVILFYGEVDSGLVRRIYPPMEPSQEIAVRYTEELESGQFAPGTPLQFWWEILGEDGAVERTAPQYFDYVDDNQSWQALAGDRVDLLWYGKSRDGTRAQSILEVSEQAISRLEQEIGISVDHRVRVYVYNSQADMRKALSSRSKVYDDRVMTLGVTVSDDTLLLLGSHSDVDMVAAHELSHIVVGLATDNPYIDLPRWLDEGLAMYAEGDFPADNKRALDRAVSDDALLSIRSMSSYSGQADQVDLYYGEVRSVVDFMLDTYGRDKMQALLGVFAQGARQEDALQAVYGLGLDALDDAWRGSLGLAPRTLPSDGPEAVVESTPIARPEETTSEPLCASILGAVLAPLLVLIIKQGLAS